MKANRIGYLDHMRGIAILGVVLTHFMGITLNMRDSAIDEFFTIFQLPVFYLVSGYFSFKGYGVPWSGAAFLRRLCVILLPLLSWSAIETFAFSRPWFYYPTHNFAGLWFLWSLFQLTLLFGVLEVIRGSGKKPVWVDVVLYGGVFAALIAASRIIPEMKSFSLHQMVNYYRYFAIGLFMRKYVSLRNVLTGRGLLPLWLMVFCTQWWFFDQNNTVLIFAGSVSGAMILWIVCESWAGKVSLPAKALARLGQLTLPVYCIHWLFVPVKWEVNTNLLSGTGGMSLQFAVSLGG